MNIYDLMSEAELSSLTAGMAGRTPKAGETWMSKESDGKIKITKVENGRVYYHIYDFEDGETVMKDHEHNKSINMIRALFRPYTKEF